MQFVSMYEFSVRHNANIITLNYELAKNFTRGSKGFSIRSFSYITNHIKKFT